MTRRDYSALHVVSAITILHGLRLWATLRHTLIEHLQAEVPIIQSLSSRNAHLIARDKATAKSGWNPSSGAWSYLHLHIARLNWVACLPAPDATCVDLMPSHKGKITASDLHKMSRLLNISRRRRLFLLYKTANWRGIPRCLGIYWILRYSQPVSLDWSRVLGYSSTKTWNSY